VTTTTEQLRAAILTPRQPPFKDVEVKGWGLVRLVGMTGAQRDHWEAQNVRVQGGQIQANRENQRARMLIECLHDPVSGERLFTDEHAPALGHQPAEILDPLFLEAAALSGVGATLESLKGNS
jgi:hypothetical protein